MNNEPFPSSTSGSDGQDNELSRDRLHHLDVSVGELKLAVRELDDSLGELKQAIASKQLPETDMEAIRRESMTKSWGNILFAPWFLLVGASIVLYTSTMLRAKNPRLELLNINEAIGFLSVCFGSYLILRGCRKLSHAGLDRETMRASLINALIETSSGLLGGLALLIIMILCAWLWPHPLFGTLIAGGLITGVRSIFLGEADRGKHRTILKRSMLDRVLPGLLVILVVAQILVLSMGLFADSIIKK